MTRDEMVANYLARFFVNFRPDPQNFFDAIKEAGFALVPIEPTEAMIKAGNIPLIDVEPDTQTEYGSGVSASAWIRAEWQAMVAAAEEG